MLVALAYRPPAIGSSRKALTASRLTVSSTSGLTRSKHSDTSICPNPRSRLSLGIGGRQSTLAYLRRLDKKVDRVLADNGEVKARLVSPETRITSLDVDRIERRLDLTDAD